MKAAFIVLAAFVGPVWWMLHGEPQHDDTVIAAYPLDDDRELLEAAHRHGGEIDYALTADGRGSLRIDVEKRTLVDLYHLWGNEEDLSFRQLVYQAKVRTEDAAAPVYLVMQAGVTPGGPGGPMAVIGRDDALTGTNDWTTLEVSAGNPAGTKLMEATLQLEIDGPGTVWIDDIRLLNRWVH